MSEELVISTHKCCPRDNPIECTFMPWCEEIKTLRARVKELEEEAELEEASFSLRWNADMRAIKRWHEAGNDDLVWPDHADLVVWLLGRIESLEATLKRVEAELESERQYTRTVNSENDDLQAALKND